MTTHPCPNHYHPKKDVPPNRMNSPVVAVKPDGGVALLFRNPSEAIHKGGINSGNLYQALKGKKKTANGYMWYYQEEHERLWFENPEQLKWKPDPYKSYFKRGARKGNPGINKGKKLKVTERGLEQRKDALKKAHEKMVQEGIYQRIAEQNKCPVQCVETGQTYPSITECAKAVGASMSSVFGAIKYGHRCKGRHYIRMV